MPSSEGIYYTISRRGPSTTTPLLLIHGAGGMNLSWPPQIRHLADTTVLALDLPNHGRSAPKAFDTLEEIASLVLDWLDRLEIAEIDCCGHSMGGAISLLMALQAPHRVRKLILIGSAARLAVNPTLLEFSSNPDTLPQAVELLIKWSFAPSTPQRIRELTARRLLEGHPLMLYRDLSACNQFDLTRKLNQIQQPTLLLTGELDRMTPVANAQWLADNLPQVQLEIIPDAGHMVVLEQPDRIAQLLWKFCHQQR